MSEKEIKIIETLGKIIPNLSESEKSYLLGLGEGMAIKAEKEPLQPGQSKNVR